MSAAPRPSPAAERQRVLVLTPTGRDAELARATFLGARIDCHVCRDMEELCAESAQDAGCLLVAEEALSPMPRRALSRCLSEQPPWSDLPLLVLTARGADSGTVARALADFSNVALIERPVRVGALVSSVRSALRARERQYEIRSHLSMQQEIQQALHEADRRKDEFLATLAHELRNPLAPIRNCLQILRVEGGNPATVERVRGVMERQLDHLVRLVDDLMEISRVSRGKIELRRQRIELADVVRTAVESVQPVIDAAGHKLALRLPAEPLPLDADPVRLAQVLGNLLNNAAKYTDDGGAIAVEAHREGDMVVVSVKDNGIGIPHEALPRVFGMFTQLAGSRRRSQGGLGIGLTLVRSLVELHGGSVAVASDGPGRGSVFTVRLPLASGEGAAQAPVPVPAAIAARRVLVVDDNRDAADSLGALLQLFGAEVRVVHDGEAALAAVRDFRPALVLLDLGMPGMDGCEVAVRIRRDPALQPVVLVALTGWGQEQDRRRTREAGFDRHLTKPTDAATLQGLLASVPSPGDGGVPPPAG